MTTNDLAGEISTPEVSPGNYSPVDWKMQDTVGAVFLGILAVVFMIAWMRSEARYRTLVAQQEKPIE